MGSSTLTRTNAIMKGSRISANCTNIFTAKWNTMTATAILKPW